MADITLRVQMAGVGTVTPAAGSEVPVAQVLKPPARVGSDPPPNTIEAE